MNAFYMADGLTRDQLEQFMSNPQIQRYDVEHVIHGIPEDETCAICMELLTKYECVKLACRHYFHDECIRNWLMRKAKCPFCNIDVRREL
jgi:hypothetical protein